MSCWKVLSHKGKQLWFLRFRWFLFLCCQSALRTSLHFNSLQRNRRFTEETHLTQQLFKRACIFSTLACLVRVFTAPAPPLSVVKMSTVSVCCHGLQLWLDALQGQDAVNTQAKKQGHIFSAAMREPLWIHSFQCPSVFLNKHTVYCAQAFNDGMFGTNVEGN